MISSNTNISDCRTPQHRFVHFSPQDLRKPFKASALAGCNHDEQAKSERKSFSSIEIFEVFVLVPGGIFCFWWLLDVWFPSKMMWEFWLFVVGSLVAGCFCFFFVSAAGKLTIRGKRSHGVADLVQFLILGGLKQRICLFWWFYTKELCLQIGGFSFIGVWCVLMLL